jgi:uncharacterized protein (TIGR02300 family)
MAKPELGLKRTCVGCGAKFYDMTRSPAHCPKCGVEQPADQPRLRRGAANITDERPKKASGTPAAEPDDIEVEDIEGDEAIEDAEELEDDAEDIAEDIEVSTDRDEEH